MGKGIERMCGFRVEGGVYVEVPMSEEGQPIEAFLIDPPIKIDPDWGLSPVGIKLIQDHRGVYHVFDWVGSESYPNVADVIEEVRRHGASRRAAKTTDFSLLTAESRLVLGHKRGFIDDFVDYFEAEPPGLGDLSGGRRWAFCPNDTPDHNHPDPDIMCSRLYHQDLDRGDPYTIVQGDPSRIGMDRIVVERKTPWGSYRGVLRPGDEPSYTPALFLSLPIGRLTVIRAEDGSHEDTLKKMKAERRLSKTIPIVLDDA